MRATRGLVARMIWARSGGRADGPITLPRLGHDPHGEDPASVAALVAAYA